MTTAEKYVTVAYLVLLGALLVYLAIIALKVGRLEEELADRPAVLARGEEAELTERDRTSWGR